MTKVVERIVEHSKEFYTSSYFLVFFGMQRVDIESYTIKPRQIDFLLKLIESKYGDVNFMRLVFGLVSSLPIEDRIQFFSKFIDLNHNFADFEQLPLEPECSSWSGSAVPMLQRRVDYLKTLVPLFDTISLLKQKLYIEQKIQNTRKEIERENKNDFMED